MTAIPLLIGNHAKHGLFQRYFTVLTEWLRGCLPVRTGILAIC
jgi:hypothetical protein